MTCPFSSQGKIREFDKSSLNQGKIREFSFVRLSQLVSIRSRDDTHNNLLVFYTHFSSLRDTYWAIPPKGQLFQEHIKSGTIINFKYIQVQNILKCNKLKLKFRCELFFTILRDFKHTTEKRVILVKEVQNYIFVIFPIYYTLNFVHFILGHYLY